MNEHKTYRIERIVDLLQVPSDRRALCIAEILHSMEKAVAAAHVLNENAPLPEFAHWGFSHIDWVDDGETNLQINAQVGEEKFNLYDSTTPEPEREGVGE